MNRTQVIILATIGLMIIAVIFGFIYSGKKKGARSHIQTEDGAMTEVPEKYTYKDLMASTGNRNFAEEAPPAPAGSVTDPPALDAPATAGKVDPPAAPTAPPAATPVETPEISTALQEIKQTRERIRGGTAAGVSSNEKAVEQEDETIRQIVASHNSTAPVRNNQEQPAPAPAPRPAGFNTLDFGEKAAPAGIATSSPVIKGVILNDIEVATGAAVRIMLLDNTTINGVAVRKNQMVTGVTNIGENRVQIHVAGTALNNQLTASNFSAYGLDGMEGLRIEGSKGEETRQAAKDELETNIDQVAGAGILGGVVRVVKTVTGGSRGKATVKIPAGYKITLKQTR
ncbi:conjugative transposon protein TraM [Chitinophaga tropicalis]|uniref:Conjugative transposon protein TraM n=1 Tax=Chitinophaga tropicalis TaxID=2683588 RepID=A0A7K1UDU8_9BACT|nr:conjugative transposon protein TraM [Chitinophaga tropicalis]MVT12513.1 conjugative transposon protein TraM [Chitinophaga tropicalis]